MEVDWGSMLTKNDIEVLKEIFCTKDELNNVENNLRTEMKDMENRLRKEIHKAVDILVKEIQTVIHLIGTPTERDTYYQTQLRMQDAVVRDHEKRIQKIEEAYN